MMYFLLIRPHFSAQSSASSSGLLGKRWWGKISLIVSFSWFCNLLKSNWIKNIWINLRINHRSKFQSTYYPKERWIGWAASLKSRLLQLEQIFFSRIPDRFYKAKKGQSSIILLLLIIIIVSGYIYTISDVAISPLPSLLVMAIIFSGPTFS